MLRPGVSLNCSQGTRSSVCVAGVFSICTDGNLEVADNMPGDGGVWFAGFAKPVNSLTLLMASSPQLFPLALNERKS